MFLLPQGEICYDINDYNKLWKYASSAGTYCVYADYSNDRKKLLLELPSGVAKESNINSLCVVGRCANIFSKYRIFGKASYVMFVKKKKDKLSEELLWIQLIIQMVVDQKIKSPFYLRGVE